MIQVKRVYDSPASSSSDGARFLVDRLWPRGIKKEALHIQGWVKDIAPSDPLRRWFSHDIERWEEFRHRYFAELDNKQGALQPLLNAAHKGNVTLLFSARDVNHNNAVVLKEYLERKLTPLSS